MSDNSVKNKEKIESESELGILTDIEENLLQQLKPYQINGIQFMWKACYKSVQHLNQSSGGGCVLAHSMGLGKSMQIVVFIHTLLQHCHKTNVTKVLILCPVSTILNWDNEFKKWIPHSDIKVRHMSG